MSGVAGRSGGRNAKTVEELRLAGTHREDRHGTGTNPNPPKIKPDSPKELTGDALEEWDRMIGRLELSGTLTLVDDAVLYQYCQLFAETEAIATRCEEIAATVKILQENFDKDAELSFADKLAVAQEMGKLVQTEARLSTQIRQGRMGLRTYLIEFGMTPAARSRVKIPKDAKPQSKFEGLA